MPYLQWSDAAALSLPPALARSLHRTMVSIRLFEERVLQDYLARRIPGFTHLYIGEEAVAAGACAALTSQDLITSTHRGHGHAIAKGVPFRAMLAELYGRSDGTCGGRGGSMHIADFGLGMLGANGIVGGGFGLAAGAALAAAHRGSGEVTLCFFGDGAVNKGTFHEVLNFSAVRRLPVAFLCENNQFAQYTAAQLMNAVDDLSKRAEAYGIPGRHIDGDDVMEVYASVHDAVEWARSGHGPSLIIAETYRYEGHSVGDAQRYRSQDEVDRHRQNDPIMRFERWLTATGLAKGDALKRVWKEVAADLDDAVQFAEASPEPDPATAFDDLFSATRAAWSLS